MFLRGLWDVSLNGDLFETSQRHLMPAGFLRTPLKGCSWRIQFPTLKYLLKVINDHGRLIYCSFGVTHQNSLNSLRKKFLFDPTKSTFRSYLILLYLDLRGKNYKLQIKMENFLQISSRWMLLYLLTYLLVVSSPCSTHSELKCNLLCHWSDGISPSLHKNEVFHKEFLQ